MRTDSGRLFGAGMVALVSLVCGMTWGQTEDQETVEKLPLQGVVLVDHWEKIPAGDPREDVSGVKVEGPEFLGSEANRSRLEERLRPFMGRDLNEGDGRWFQELLRAVEMVCREAGRPLVDVFLPRGAEQDFSRGRVHVVVFEGKIGTVATHVYRWKPFRNRAVEVESNPEQQQRFQNQLLGFKAGARVQRGQATFERDTIERGLKRLNIWDYQQADLALQRGTNVSGTDLALSVTNRFFLEPYVGYDDTGNTLTGWERLFAGVAWHNLWGAGHRVAYQFTSDLDFSDYLAHAISYAATLPWGHSVAVFGGFADLNLDLRELEPQLAPSQDGRNVIASIRYTAPLADVRRARPEDGVRYRHEVFAGFDYKDIETSLEFSAGGTSPVADFLVAQFVLGYRGLLVDRFGTNMFALQGFLSPGGLSDRNDDGSFQDARPSSSADYLYGQLSIMRETPLFRLPLYWTLAGDFQVANSPLVPSEQFGVGGASTVRGFEQAVVLGDQAVIVRNELGVDLPWLSRRLASGGKPGGARLHAFFDYGHNFLEDDNDTVSSELGLGSVGGGVNLRWGRHLTLVVDYAVQVIGRDAEELGGGAVEDIDSRFHVYGRFSY